MRRSGLLVILVSGLLVGCNKGPGAGEPTAAESGSPAAARVSGVAVIDLDDVAQQLGKDVDMVTAIRQGQASVAQQLKAHQTSLQQEFQQKAEQLQSDPSAGAGGEEARQQQLAKLQQQYKGQLNQVALNAQNELKAHQQRLLARFRDEVKPVAQQVAAERGLGVVVTKNESVLLSFDEAHDITAAVVAKLRATQPPAASPDRTATSTNRTAPSTSRLR